MVAIKEAKEANIYDLELKKVLLRSLDLLTLVSKIRKNLQVLAYLMLFKKQYQMKRKFRPDVKKLNKILDFYSFNQKDESSIGALLEDEALKKQI